MDRRPGARGAARTPSPTVVAIDFGSTYSGIAYARAGHSMPIVHNLWPAGGDKPHVMAPKVPSVLGIDAEQQVCWGYAVSFEDERLQLFKLLLVKQDFLPQTLRSSPLVRAIQDKSATLGMTARDLVGTYLKYLWGDFVKSAVLSQEEWMGIQLVVTIPAGWPNSVRDDITDALGDAGILTYSPGCQVRFLREPHAAAQAMMRDLDESIKLKKDDIIIVCDAGGLTVDCVTYQITSTCPPQMKEVVASAGRLNGVAFMQNDFLRLLHEKVASAGLEDLLDTIQDHELEWFAETSWDLNILPKFNGQDAYLNIVLPPAWAGKRCVLRFYRDELMGLFNSPVRDVCEVVLAQHKAAIDALGHSCVPKHVLLSGGFSGNPYLRSVLPERVPSPTKVHWYNDANLSWSAVCRGAVLAVSAAENPSSRLGPEALTAPADYCIMKSNGDTRWIVHQGQHFTPRQRIALEPADFRTLTCPPAVHGDPHVQVIRLVLGRGTRGQDRENAAGMDPGAQPRPQLRPVCEVDLRVDVDGTELELLVAANTVAGIKFAVWRNGLPLGSDAVQVCYHC